MMLEQRLCTWLTAGLALYKAHPLMIESIFYDASQSGRPSMLGPGVLVDREKLWLVNEYTGGVLRWGTEVFPILSNTVETLTLDGDPSLVPSPELPWYQIVPAGVAGLTEFLATEKFAVLSSFAQVPTAQPAITIRLERDTQADTYLGEHLEQYTLDGTEFQVRSQAITGHYLLSIWTANREATLWLYSWLLSYGLNSLPMFTTWGLYDVAFSGSDLDPATAFLAERVYTRHLLLSATRIERAVQVVGPVEYVGDACIRAAAAYAEFAAPLPQPMS
jgi:hypothetical protein